VLGMKARSVKADWLPAFPLPATLLALAGLAVQEATDPDLWWHMATGRYILSQRYIPAYDIFSYTATSHRWVTHEWLSDVLLYSGYRLTGFIGLSIFFALVITTAFALVFLTCRTRPVVAACSVMVAAVASHMTWGVRPQMFTLLFTSLYLYILDRDSLRASRLVWLLPPLGALWANLHSGFMAGLAVIAVHVVGRELSWLRRWRGQGPLLGPGVGRLALVGVLSGLCMLLTPNGVAAALFPFGTLSNNLIQQHISEWASPNFHLPMTWPLALFWLLLLGTMALSRQRISATELLLLSGATVAALYSMRHVTFLSLVGAPILARQAAALRPAPPASKPAPAPVQAVFGVALVALGVVLGARIHSIAQGNAEAQRRAFPIDAVQYLQAHHLAGRIFNTYQWGGYLIWQGYSVFVDGRAEVYGDEILNEYLKANDVQADWEEPLQRYGVGICLIESSSRLAVLLKASGRWQAVYSDNLATVFVPAQVASSR